MRHSSPGRSCARTSTTVAVADASSRMVTRGGGTGTPLRGRYDRARKGVPVPPPRVTILDDASATATVVEVRAHDRPGLLWRIGHVLGSFGAQVRAARVETLGAEAVDVFYVVDSAGAPLTDESLRASIRAGILDVVR